MKYCPVCGSPNVGNPCKCGFVYDDEKSEEVAKDIKEKYENYHRIFNELKKIDFSSWNYVPLKEIKKYKVDCGELLSLSFNSHGSMMGGFYTRRVDFKEKTYVISNQANHAADIETVGYKVNDEDLDKIKKIVEEANLPIWSKIKIDNTLIAYDAPTSSISLIYEDHTFNIDSLVYKDEDELNIIRELNEILSSLEKEDKKFEDKKEKSNFNNNIGFGPGMMGIAMGGTINGKKFCPECARSLDENATKCSCGYEYK